MSGSGSLSWMRSRLVILLAGRGDHHVAIRNDLEGVRLDLKASGVEETLGHKVAFAVIQLGRAQLEQRLEGRGLRDQLTLVLVPVAEQLQPGRAFRHCW
eukprot:5317437-Prymnesium_polylepis.1